MNGADAAPPRSADLAGLLGRWSADLASWAIPERIRDSVPDSPWVLPGQVFARKAMAKVQ